MATKKRRGLGLKAIVVILLIIGTMIFWGVIGNDEAQKIEKTCDVGMKIGNIELCWLWHKNFIGEIQEELEKNKPKQ